MKPHKHAELIKAWADGAEIEEQHLKKDWHPFTDGHWMESDSWNYRIKPEPKPDVIRYACYDVFNDSVNLQLRMYRMEQEIIAFQSIGQLKLTIDGDTGKIKSAEVL